jgi:hypothetical protein
VRTVAVEVQRSRMQPRSAMSRTARARKNGLEPIWHFSNDRAPAIRQVPHVVTNFEPGYPDRRRSLTVVSGVRKVVPVKCAPFRGFDYCPVRGHGYCGQYHPQTEVLHRITVDDMAEQAPAGGFVPLRFRDRSKIHNYWVRPDSAALYFDLTGAPGKAELIVTGLTPPRPGHVRDCSNAGMTPAQDLAAEGPPPTWSPLAHAAAAVATRRPCQMCGMPSALVFPSSGPRCEPHFPNRSALPSR